MKVLLPLILLAFTLGACEESLSPTAEPMDAPAVPVDEPAAPNPTEEPSPQPVPEQPENQPAFQPVPVETGSPAEVELAERSGATIPTRPRRRMNVDQLSVAMRQVGGGIGWTETRGGNEVDLFQSLATTLGKPDFAQATDEDLDPSTVFQKFLDDAARVTCTRMLENDMAIFEAEETGEPIEGAPVLLIHAGPSDTLESNPDAVDANLITALQRFHGRVITDRGDPGLSNWRWLFKSSVFVTGEPNQAWLGLCLALFTHPDFYTY